MPTTPSRPPRVALVGDRSPSVKAHTRIPAFVEALSVGQAEPIELYWVATTDIEAAGDVEDFDGIWVVPGSPYARTAGVLTAIRTAREASIPLLGTCGGFQHLLLEFARDVVGLSGLGHAETDPGAPELLIVPLACSMLGQEASVVIAEGTLAAAVMGAGPTTERYFCRFGLNRDYLEILTAHGLVVSGTDPAGDARVVELPGHPFFIGSLFQPELSSDPTWVHPLIVGFASAVRTRAGAGIGV